MYVQMCFADVFPGLPTQNVQLTLASHSPVVSFIKRSVRGLKDNRLRYKPQENVS